MPEPKYKDSHRVAGSCCDWQTFREGFLEAFAKWFETPPTDKHWSSAVRDWKHANTGWEAAHNAQRRAKERVHKLVHLGGPNYAIEGSTLAQKYGRTDHA